VNSIAIQSLVDLDRRVWALKFLISKAESKKKYMKVLGSLEKEGAKLVSIILKNLIPIEIEETSVSSVNWNRVMTTVDSNTIYIARYSDQLLIVLFVIGYFLSRLPEKHCASRLMRLFRLLLL
jgi:hypothetical protein